jgi:ATP-dependent Clp protease ATP-binding subunit ClpC
MFERYTESARRVIFFARFEVSQFGGTTIESEHLLLGMLHAGQAAVTRFVRDATLADLRDEITGQMTRKERVATSVDLPLSDESKRILAYAGEETERLRSDKTRPEHLLLAMLREEKSTAAQILHRHGLKPDAVRDELARSPMPKESALTSTEAALRSALLNDGGLPTADVVPDSETAKRIAEDAWASLYGAELIAAQKPLQAEHKFNVWIVNGSAQEHALFAFILQSDGRVVSVGRA